MVNINSYKDLCLFPGHHLLFSLFFFVRAIDFSEMEFLLLTNNSPFYLENTVPALQLGMSMYRCLSLIEEN